MDIKSINVRPDKTSAIGMDLTLTIFQHVNWLRQAGKYSLLCMLVIFVLLEPGHSFAQVGISEEGFDILLVIDDSHSMGAKFSSNKSERSDPEERRNQAANLLMNQFYTAARIANRVGQKRMDIRISVLAFGSQPKLQTDWFLVNHETPPTPLFLTSANRQWTDFNKALAKAFDQFGKIDYGRLKGDAKRKLVIILLTDGEPSIRSNPDNLYADGRVWKKMHDHLRAIKASNKSLDVFVVAMNNPTNDYWPKVKDRWHEMQDIPVIPVVIKTLGLTNQALFKTLYSNITDRLYPMARFAPDVNGRFKVPCFQAGMSIEIYYHGEKRDIKLIDPGGVKIDPKKQPRFFNSDTYMQFDIDNPVPGEYQFTNYSQNYYDSHYSVIPFSVEYIYPGANGELLPTPQKIKMRLLKEGDKFTSAEIASCDLAADMNYQLGVGQNMQAAINMPFASSVDNISGDLLLESTTEFAADLNEPNYHFKFELSSKGKRVFVDKRDFRLSGKTPLVTKIDRSATTTSLGEIQFELKLQLINYRTNGAVDLATVFSEPDKSLSVGIHCEGFKCAEKGSNTSAVSSPGNSVLKTLTVLDPKTLGVSVNLSRAESALANLWNAAWLGGGSEVSMEIRAAPGVSINDEYVFVKPP